MLSFAKGKGWWSCTAERRRSVEEGGSVTERDGMSSRLCFNIVSLAHDHSIKVLTYAMDAPQRINMQSFGNNTIPEERSWKLQYCCHQSANRVK